VKFSTFAIVAIKRTIDRFLTNEGHTIRVPPHAGKVQAELVGAESADAIDIDALVAKTGASADTVRATIAVRVGGLESLHVPGVISRAEQGRQSDSELVPSAVLRDVTFSAVRGAMEQLDPVSRGIIELRFGFGSEPAATLAECARRFSLPKSRVARIIDDGLAEIQEFLSKNS
jgi:DNA-directed RNA polymerase sigma subunit (sigma70/sigma32)